MPSLARHGPVILALIVTSSFAATVSAQGCPFRGAQGVPDQEEAASPPRAPFSLEKFREVDFEALQADIESLLTDSQDSWPADFGNYGPFFVRLAWHCTGSYRRWDGRGGCDGARIRMFPEYAWPDNTNLDKARQLLWPLKRKYGSGLSWGDLITFTGTVAITSMGGPSVGFCAGRIDDQSGFDSTLLGPTEEQAAVLPCKVNGNCTEPLGQTTIGLIYVNPEGPMGEPHPKGSVADIRSTFGNMGMNDRETVALIGGGHAFGKTHGACLTGPGPSPLEDPSNPWPGTCGPEGPMFGKGENAFTAGFEGPWTTTPTSWDNQYFNNLIESDWEKYKSPGGHWQWRQSKEGAKDVMMLTSDVALLEDDSYRALVHEFAANQTQLEIDFANAWYKLMSRDMGPVSRCLGPMVPPARSWQDPLPSGPTTTSDSMLLTAEVELRTALSSESLTGASPDLFDGKPSHAAAFVELAYRCAATYRRTDYFGGCNGARIRLPPQSEWPINAGLDKVIRGLESIRAALLPAGRSVLRLFGEQPKELSIADTIVLAGKIALEDAGAKHLSFCPGRVDAEEPSAAPLGPRVFPNDPSGIQQAKDDINIKGLTLREGVALAARLRSKSLQMAKGYRGTWATAEEGRFLSNTYFSVLLDHEWEVLPANGGMTESDAEYRSKTDPDRYMMHSDLAIRHDPILRAIAMEYVSDNHVFLHEFARGWTKLMNADRFVGPTGNVCD